MNDAIVCRRVAPGVMTIRGTTILKCCVCGEDVYISRASRDIAEEKSLEIICGVCFVEKLKSGDKPEIRPMSESQQAELRESLAEEN